MNLQALKPIKHNGKRYKVGEIIENIDEKQAKRLINLGAATNTVAVSSVIDQKVEDHSQNQSSIDNLDGNTNSSKVDKNSVDDELGSGDDLLSDEEVFKLIWDGFKLEELKEQATDLKLEFAGNISKTDLINLIIEKEKEDHFLDQIDE